MWGNVRMYFVLYFHQILFHIAYTWFKFILWEYKKSIWNWELLCKRIQIYRQSSQIVINIKAQVWQNLDWLDYILEKDWSCLGYLLQCYSLINLGTTLRVTWCTGYHYLVRMSSRPYLMALFVIFPFHLNFPIRY